jgi:toxin YoeB
MRGLQLDNRAFEELREWAVENPKTLQRILRIIEECQRDPFKGIGKPEPLKGDLKGYWSRRINDEDRLVYKVTEDFIIIRSMKEHHK